MQMGLGCVQNTLMNLWPDAAIDKCPGAAQKPAFSSESASLPVDPTVDASLNGILVLSSWRSRSSSAADGNAVWHSPGRALLLCEASRNSSHTTCCCCVPSEKRRARNCWSFQSIPWNRKECQAQLTQYHISVLCACEILTGKLLHWLKEIQ